MLLIIHYDIPDKFYAYLMFDCPCTVYLKNFYAF